MSGLNPFMHGFCFYKIERLNEGKIDRDACLCKKRDVHIDKSGFATCLARACHPFGKTLPSAWQDFATCLAKLCHTFGKAWQNGYG